MTAHQPEDYDYFEVFQPVLSGAEGFLSVAENYANDIFGIRYVASYVTKEYIPESDDLDSLPQKIRIPTGPPRLKVYDQEDLKVTLLHRRAPTSMNYHGKFAYADGRLLRRDDVVHRPIKQGGTKESPEIMTNGEKRYHDKSGRVYRTSPIWEELEHIGYRYDIMPQENRPMICNSLTSQIDSSSGDIELSLAPAIESPVTKMLLKFARECVKALAEVPSQKTAHPDGGAISLNVPFARLPEAYMENDEADYIKVLNEELARKPVRLALGGLESRVGRTRHRSV